MQFSKDKVRKLIQEAMDKSLRLYSASRLDDAEIVIRQVLKVDLRNDKAHQLLGLILYSKNRYEDAINEFQKSLDIKPKNSESLNNMSLCYNRLNNNEQAMKCIKKAIKIKPNSPQYLSNLGVQFRKIGQPEEAIGYFRKSLKIKDAAHVWDMMGGSYGELKNMQEAERCFIKALQINPEYAAAHVNLAYCYHLMNDYKKAWPEYEWRFQYFQQAQFFNKVYDPQKKWDGKKSLENKNIIIYCEQGAGDAIQFIRYIKPLKERNCKVTLHCPKELISLFKEIPDDIFVLDVVEETENVNHELGPGLSMKKKQIVMRIPENIPEHDYHASLLSLPYLLDMPIINDPIKLNVNKNFNASNYDDKIKIGIVWAGNPQHPNDAVRSCHLKRFKKIHDIPGVKLFSLMKDLRRRKYHNSENIISYNDGCEDMQVLDLSEEINSFEDTAAIIKEMDIIISVDTAVLHLAASLSDDKSIIGLIPYNPDWRWGLHGTKTPWYSKIKLLRQPKRDDWDSVFNTVYQIVQELSSK